MSGLAEQIVAVARSNEAKAGPCPYPAGTLARVLRRVVEDGVTPLAWAGAVCRVESAHIAPGRSYWRLVLRHPNGEAARFDEDEMDRRYGPRGGAA